MLNFLKRKGIYVSHNLVFFKPNHPGSRRNAKINIAISDAQTIETPSWDLTSWEYSVDHGQAWRIGKQNCEECPCWNGYSHGRKLIMWETITRLFNNPQSIYFHITMSQIIITVFWNVRDVTSSSPRLADILAMLPKKKTGHEFKTNKSKLPIDTISLLSVISAQIWSTYIETLIGHSEVGNRDWGLGQFIR